MKDHELFLNVEMILKFGLYESPMMDELRLKLKKRVVF